MRTAADAAAQLNVQRLAFSRRQRLERESARSQPWRRATFCEHDRRRHPGRDHAGARAVAGAGRSHQVELAVLNLAINARDAMQIGGSLHVSTRGVALGPPRCAEEPAAGDYVEICVADTGAGMSAEVRAKVFEPFFTTKEVGIDGKRWWFVDPEGYAFLSAGIDCIRDRAEGIVTGQEDLFSWLPPKNDSLFSKAYGNQQRSRMLQVDFVQSNLIRVFGADYRTKWEQITTGLLKQWRINTIANWSDIDYARRAKIPYVLNMSRFPSSNVLLYRDFPDVFSEEYARNSVVFAKQLEKFKDDPYLIGYFLSNEPHWAFGDNNLAFEMFAINIASATKQKMGGWLKEKYKGDISTFNNAWKQNMKDFGEIPAMIMKESPSAECWNDCKEFSGIMVDQYIKTVCDEVKKVDPHHLNLGMRYAWMSSELCYRAGAYFDVFSINGYSNPAPPETAEITRRSGKPVIIGEYHFGSIDRGLPATGIQGAENQQARGEAYRYYLEQGFSRPELIGIHYFQWMDQPVFGRSDGENYNIGFLDICMHPYRELTDQAKLSHEQMYKVASGEEMPFDKIIRKTAQIFY